MSIKGKILNVLSNTLLVNRKSVGPLIDNGKINRSLRSFLSQGGDLEVSDPYKKSVWVYSAVNAISQNISATAPFRLYHKSDNDKIYVEQGPLYDVFNNPNPWMTKITLMQSTIIYLELFGEAFWVLDGRKNLTDIPEQIWCLSPERFEHVVDYPTGKFTGYWDYNNGRTITTLAPWEVLQFKYFNPYHDVRGMSPVDAARLGVEQDYFASLYNKNFFKDGAKVGGAIEVEEGLTDDQWLRLRTQFEDRHKGYQNAHKVAIIEGGKWKPDKNSQKDMEFISLKDVTRGEILAAYKINEVVLGNYKNIQSYEGIKNAHKTFWEETLIPKIKLLTETLQSKFLVNLVGEPIYCEFDLTDVQSLRQDLVDKVTACEKLFKMGWPINQINKILNMGFDEVPWGDTWFVPLNTVDVGDVMEKETPIYEPPEPPKSEDEEDKEETPNGKTAHLDLSDKDNAMWARYIAKQLPIENMIKGKISRFYFEQRKTVLKNIHNETPTLFNVQEEQNKCLQMLKPLYYIAATTGVEMLAEELGVDSIPDDDGVTKFVDERLSRATSLIINRIKVQLVDILEGVSNNNYTIEQIADQIRDVYNKVINKVGTTARTETNTVINGVRFIQMHNAGVKYTKWLSKTEKGREGHTVFDGKIVQLGQSFSDEFTLRYPCDVKAPAKEVVNCLCYTVPTMKR